VLALLVDDPSFPERLQQWLWTANATLLSIEPRDTILEARIRVDPTQANESLGLAKPAPMIHLDSERCALLLLHDDPEALRAALLIANGAAAQGMDTTVFFTFWALNLLREPKMKWTIGKRLLCAITRRQPITCLPELIDHAQQLGVRFTACTMSMSLLGIAARDLHPHPNLDFAGVASFLDDARHASIALVF
jgi:peroxiredoxin family protein